MMDMSNKHMRPTGCKDIVGDRISSLPDVLLHHILSFTTAREAVQTCVLSTRWRHTWQSLQCLTIAVREFTSKKGFVKFMDNILLRRGCVPLDSFHLMGWNGGVSLNHPRANLWVCHALRSNVRVLGITEYSCCLFIEKLFSGCPALEDLAMGISGHKVNEVLRRDLLRCETFSNLKILSVGEWSVGANLGALIHFLRCSLILEKLTVHLSMIGTSVCDGPKDNPLAKKTRKLFHCKRLKKVKITCPQGDERVYDIMKIIIANASSLPKIVIDPFEY